MLTAEQLPVPPEEFFSWLLFKHPFTIEQVCSSSTPYSVFLNFGFVSKKSNLDFPFVCPMLLRSVSSYEAGEEFDRTESSKAKENPTSLERSQNSKKAELGVELEFTRKLSIG